MSVLQGVLLEEINRLESNIFNYKKMLSSLPKGSLFIRRMGNSEFVYRKRKENGKVVSEYLGNINSVKVKEQMLLSNEYKRICNNIKIAEKELLKLKKAYKIYDR